MSGEYTRALQDIHVKIDRLLRDQDVRRELAVARVTIMRLENQLKELTKCTHDFIPIDGGIGKVCTKCGEIQ
jgi:hypothetical protein